ncbi:MAG: penicillin-binding protein [Dictyoglomus sp. NZ13-RE01]|nr:MAG: penicillin-binding protein [Dictyoglomus sp. NZ13-RE01]
MNNKKRLRILTLFWFICMISIEVILLTFQVNFNIYGNQFGNDIQINRGKILDRNGNELVSNCYRKSLVVNPLNIGESEKEKIIRKLSKILNLPEKVLSEKLNMKSNFVWVKRILGYSEIEKLSNLLSYNKIFLVDEKYRNYHLSVATSPLLGFVGVDNQGLYGLEAVLDQWLREGNNVYLTIDKDLQATCANYLREGVEKYKAKGGYIGILDVSSGEILAFSMLPDYDYRESLDSLIDKIHEKNPINFIIEPGSVFKIITASIALEEGIVNLNETVECRGEEKVNGHTIRCTEEHGKVNLEKAIEKSCNIYFYHLAQKIPNSVWYKYFKRLHILDPIDSDINLTLKDSLIPDINSSKFTKGTLGFGQGIGFTPLKILWLLSYVGNNGNLKTLHLIKKIEDLKGKNIYNDKTEEFSVVSPDTSKKILSYMFGVVERGTASNLNLKGLKIAGKTGTAQVAKDNGYIPGVYNHLFYGFLFLQNKTYAIIVILLEPKIGKYAKDTVVPIFKEIAKRLVIYDGRWVQNEKF